MFKLTQQQYDRIAESVTLALDSPESLPPLERGMWGESALTTVADIATAGLVDGIATADDLAAIVDKPRYALNIYNRFVKNVCGGRAPKLRLGRAKGGGGESVQSMKQRVAELRQALRDAADGVDDADDAADNERGE